MGKTAALGVVIGVVTIGFATPAMATGTVHVVPGTAQRGQHVTIQVKECGKSGSVAKSTAFAADVPLNTEGEVEGVVGLATIASQATWGTHPVYVDCEGVSYAGQVTVVGGRRYPVPDGGAKTGLGGSGVSLPLVGAGSLLVLGAAGTGAAAIRRRRSDAKA